MKQYKVPESDVIRISLDWAIRSAGHDLSYYSTGKSLLDSILPKYNEAMEAFKQYNQSAESLESDTVG